MPARLARFGADQALRASKKIACFDVNPAHDLKRMELAEDRAVNLGVSVRLFPAGRGGAILDGKLKTIDR